MDSRIEILKKNYEERMNEFVNVLSSSDYLPGCKVLDEWRFHLELTLKGSGWYAIYKPSKKKQQLPGPDLINELVLVEKVIFHNFEACVVGAEQCEPSNASEVSSLTAKLFTVSLEDLFPCIKQPNPEIDGIEINNILDKLRFFKQNLWLPWDEEDDDDTDWRVSALEPRMQLLYDMEQCHVNCEVAERVRRLFSQAWRSHETLRTLELTMDEEGDSENLETHETQNQEEEEGVVIRMMQLHHRIDNIQKELERLQNPLIRNLMVREKQRALKKTRKIKQAWVRLVWLGGATGDLNSCIAEAAKLKPSNEHLKVYPLLQMALEEASAGDYVLLAPGAYTLLGSGGLEQGGTIQGLGTKRVLMSGCEAGDVMLSLHCDTAAEEDSQDAPNFSIHNVTLDAHGLEICLLINRGHVLLDNCKVDGGGSHTGESVGIMVRGGAKLTARNCSFTGFCTGILAYEGSAVELITCSIQNCETGMQLFRGVKAELEKCSVSDCSNSGVMYKWQGQGNFDQDTVVTSEVLNSLPGVKVSETDLAAVQIVVQQPPPGSPEPSTSDAASL